MASALRDITALLGPSCMIQEVAQLAQTHFQTLAAHGCGSSCTSGPHQGSAELQNPSFTGICGSGFIPVGLLQGGVGPQRVSEGGGSCSWSGLESALYAANVVLGKADLGPADEQHVQLLSQLAAASVTCSHGSLKLAGTALTLLGGLGPWFGARPNALPALLTAVAAALKCSDEKLSRNAATCVQRLTGCDALCSVLVEQQGGWVNGLLQEYQGRGGTQQSSQAGGWVGLIRGHDWTHLGDQG